MKSKLSRFAVPYVVWMAIFVVAPIVIMVVYAFAGSEGGFTLDNFVQMGGYAAVFGRSFKLALIATAICLLLGYPAAWILSNAKLNRSKVTVMLFILPMWINMLIRTLATVALFDFLRLPLGEGALIFGMVYNFLPFMIYPIYNTLEKMDKSYIEAAQDLGASPAKVFTKVTVPLSIHGVLSGILMVFMPTISTFAISELLTLNKVKLLGTTIQENINNGMWNYGSTIALIMLLIIGVTTLFSDSEDKRDNESGGLI